MMEFTEKELFCLARHIIAQHYEETYPLTYISLYNDSVERYKKRKEDTEVTTEEIEKAKKEYHFLQQSKREYRTIHDAFRGRMLGTGFPYVALLCCEECPNKKDCEKISNKEYTDKGTLQTYFPSYTIIDGITEKLKPFIKENLKSLNLTDFDDWGAMDEL